MNVPLCIESKDNPRLRQVRGLLEQASARKKSGQTVLEGIHLLDAYQKAGLTPDTLWLTKTALAHPEVMTLRQHWPDVLTLQLPDALYQDMRTLGPGVDIMGVITPPTRALPDIFERDVLILESVQDAGNVGTLLRTAAAAGVVDVVCITGTAAAWSPRVLRAGMGAQFGLHVYEHVSIDDVLPRLRVPLYVTSLHVQTTLYEQNLRAPSAWLMGNEGQGASDTALAHSIGITIPQPGGQESLNVAVAGAVCLFEMVRQRLMT